MPDFTYVGDLPVRELWGVEFPRGEAVSVDNAELAQKCRNLGDFVEGEAEVEPLPDPEISSEPETNAVIEDEPAQDVAEPSVDDEVLLVRLDDLEARVAALESLAITPDTPDSSDQEKEVAESIASVAKAQDPDLEIPHPASEKPEKPEDYIAPEPEAGESSIPTLGEGVLPANWRDEHWKTKQAWCKELLNIEVSNKEEAEFYLEEALKG